MRQTDFAPAEQLVTDGLATGFPPSTPYDPTGFDVNCPVVSLDVNPNG